ncbi:heavy-metal-associated domain-containing protein [Lutibaculum baratangense]|uniref:Heavy metal binding protein n=1 Tax=Lutibaculum baratangense AMV1 TaxID=631454 RepID=V4TMJ6_9HYPH|nr:heavy-metal-associated domain-containing protein [Lutibaculum baratangense]ESR26968.1 Heavy metal binding protein [Lutibaculum baratangense AMV1]
MTTLQIEGMSCGHCRATVEAALAGVDGVTAVRQIDIASGRATVEGTAPVEALVAAVEVAGYEARPL